MHVWSLAARLAACLAAAAAGAAPAFADDPPAELTAPDAPANAVWVDGLSLGSVQSTSVVRPGRSAWDRPMNLDGVPYPHGLGVQGVSEMDIALHGDAVQFESMVGIDNEVTNDGAVVFTVEVDGKTVFDSGRMIGMQPPKLVTVDLTGAKTLTLRVTDARPDNAFGDNADWAGALIRLAPGATVLPATIVLPQINEAPTWTPDPDAPALHGPQVVGASPGRPFLFLVPATGQGPMSYTASGLPAGLTLAPQTGIITGRIATPGEYQARVTATSAAGAASQTLTLACGPKMLARTPPMGWSSLGINGDSVTDADVRGAADWLIKTGLAAHGYQYIVLSDSWEGARDARGVLHPNHRFPDMKALADYVHAKGLKFGLYSSSTAKTCSGYVGSLGHEAQDAQTFADWGVDYLSYDWCPTPTMNTATDTTLNLTPRATSADLQSGFAAMGDALGQTHRDIVYAISLTIPAEEYWRLPWMNPDPSTWAAHVNAESMDTDSGVADTAAQVLPLVSARTQFAQNFGVGHWGGFGPLAVGRSGYPQPHLTRLQPSEQMMQMSLWCLFSAPLFVSCDLANLNPNRLSHDTTAVLTNDEVLAIDRDPLAAPPKQFLNAVGQSAWMKPLADGQVAVVLVNATDLTHQDKADWPDLGLTGSQPVHDLWTHQDLGVFTDSFEAMVPARGVMFVTIGRPKTAAEVQP